MNVKKKLESIKSKIKGASIIGNVLFFIAVVILLDTNFLSTSYFSTPQKLLDNINIATKGIRAPNSITKDYSPMGFISYKYYNSTPELLETILANLEAQNNWQKVPKDEMEYPEATIAEYCNQDFSVAVMQFDGFPLRAISEWKRGSYCVKKHKASLKESSK